MTRYSPNDPAFNKVAAQEIEGGSVDERVVFIDHNNQILEVIYTSQFKNGLLQRERERLEQDEVLKGIIHISAATLGPRQGHGRQYSTIEYLPEEAYYVRSRTVFPASWVSDAQTIDTTVQATQDLFNDNDGEEDEEQKS